MRWLVLSLLVVTSCSSGLRFRDQPIAWFVNDYRDAEQPEEREYLATAYMADIFALRRLTRAMELRDHNPAVDTNALDEVPTSSWFENRLSIRAVSPREAARGPVVDGPPRPPYQVVSGKSGGGNPGFMIRDASGRRFLVKFDTKDNPEMQTGTNAIVNRIFWTAGYNVPQDTIFYFGREELRIKPGATYKNELLDRVLITEEWLSAVLLNTLPGDDGRYRATASQFLDGVPAGPFAMEGTRSDDPNDVLDHEDRRSLRGLRALAAWVNHVDIKEDNTLDMWVEEDGRRFLRHYLLDFGEALGSHRAEKGRPEDGFEHTWDWERNTAAVFTLGLWDRPWEDLEPTEWPAIGAFDAAHFDPERWREAYPYWPFMAADAADLYWGAKLVVRFDRAMIDAIVAEAEFSDPAASRYLSEVLWRRRIRIGRAWLEAVTPLDYFRMVDGALCMVDVAVRYGVAAGGYIERIPDDYRVEFDDDRAEKDRAERGVKTWAVPRDGRLCIPIEGDDAYRVARLRVSRGPDDPRRPMQVHYRGGADARVLGVVRVDRL